MDIKILFGNNVRRHRLAAGLSQEELALRVDADQAYISRIEAGQLNPTLETVSQFAEALNLKVAELFSEDS